MVEIITATPIALDLIQLVQGEFGEILFIQPDGCLEGSAAHCYKVGEISAGPDERMLGVIAGVAFYVGPRTFASWRNSQLIIDVEPGLGDDSFSLESHFGCHFVNRWIVLDKSACTEDVDRVAQNLCLYFNL
jgi:hypothetical protein